MNNLDQIQSKFNKDQVFFITPDVKRGLGLELFLPGYHIICSYQNPLIPVLRNQGISIFCLEDMIGKKAENYNNSSKLIENKEVNDYIRKKSKGKAYIIYFKPSRKMDKVIEDLGFNKIANDASLNEFYENKINSADIFKKYFPENYIKTYTGSLKNLSFDFLSRELGLPIVIQFGHGWAGKTTFIISNYDEYDKLVVKFPQTRIKVSRYVQGLTFLNNCCIYHRNILVGPPAIQINAIQDLYPNPAVTCGRQWPAVFLSKKQKNDIYRLSSLLGKLMMKSGFKGFFGIDFILCEQSGNIFISEINSRLTASSPFYTYLEKRNGTTPLIIYHLAAFMRKNLPKPGIPYDIKGSQLIVRYHSQKRYKLPKKFGIFHFNTGHKDMIKGEYRPDLLDPNDYIYLPQTNKTKIGEGEEIARFETTGSILSKPNKLRQEIMRMISNV